MQIIVVKYNFSPDFGGGATKSIGIYLVQLATMIFGPEPEYIQGVGGLNQTGQ